MDIRNLIEDAVSLAKVAGLVLPGVSGGAAIAEKVLDMVDGLKAAAPDDAAAADLEAAHVDLFKQVTDKGLMLSARLRGNAP